MTKFEKWCESKGYAVEAGIHTHVLSNWADEFAASETNTRNYPVDGSFPKNGGKVIASYNLGDIIRTVYYSNDCRWSVSTSEDSPNIGTPDWWIPFPE